MAARWRQSYQKLIGAMARWCSYLPMHQPQGLGDCARRGGGLHHGGGEVLPQTAVSASVLAGACFASVVI